MFCCWSLASPPLLHRPSCTRTRPLVDLLGPLEGLLPLTSAVPQCRFKQVRSADKHAPMLTRELGVFHIVEDVPNIVPVNPLPLRLGRERGETGITFPFELAALKIFKNY